MKVYRVYLKSKFIHNDNNYLWIVSPDIECAVIKLNDILNNREELKNYEFSDIALMGNAEIDE